MSAWVEETAAHLAPTACYICGAGEHPAGEHVFWSNADAEAFFTRQDADRDAQTPSMSAVETLDPREAVHS